MKKLIYFLTICIAIGACREEEQEDYITFDPPDIADNAENVALRPHFGFDGSSGSGSKPFKFRYYCDTINPPQKIYVDNVEDPLKSNTNLDAPMCKPGTPYYWQCEAYFDGYSEFTEVFTFTTVSLEELYGHWRAYHYVPYNEYQSGWFNHLQWHREYKDLMYDKRIGNLVSFIIDGDSVKQGHTFIGGFEGSYVDSGNCKLNGDKIRLIDNEYQLINFGTTAGNMELAIKWPNADYIQVFHKE